MRIGRTLIGKLGLLKGQRPIFRRRGIGMSDLRIESWIMPAVKLGSENPLPDLELQNFA